MKQTNHHRLLKLKELLIAETDEENEVTIYMMQEKLMHLLELDKLDIRMLKKDIEALQSMDFTMGCRGRSVVTREFSR